MTKISIRITAPKRRNAVVRDLLTPKYRQRVEVNKKRAQKLDRNLSKKQAFSLD